MAVNSWKELYNSYCKIRKIASLTWFPPVINNKILKRFPVLSYINAGFRSLFINLIHTCGLKGRCKKNFGLRP